MQGVWQDVRSGFRYLARHRVFALAAVGGLALAIGANTAIFSLVSAALLDPLPYAGEERLVWIWPRRTDRDKAFFSVPDFVDVRQQVTTLEAIGAYANWGVNVTGKGDPERLQGARVTLNTFELLGVKATLGRTLEPADAQSENPKLVAIAHGLWERRFGRDAGIVGQTMPLNGDAYTVVGVLPANFFLPHVEAEVFAPFIPETDARRKERGTNFLRPYARLRPGVTPTQAQEEMGGIMARLRELYPVENGKKITPRVLPMREELTGDYRASLGLLLAAVGAVLLIGCCNLANLLAARGAGRRQELAIRSAMGASRARLARQLITEASLLALLGTLSGILLARLATDSLRALLPAELAKLGAAGLDARVLGFTAGVAMLAALFIGVMPALQSVESDAAAGALVSAGRVAGSRRTNRMRSLLVVSEVALSLTLLVCGGLFLSSFVRLQGQSAGFAPERIVFSRASLPPRSYHSPTRLNEFVDKVFLRLGSVPEVRGVAAANALPLSAQNVRIDFRILGRDARRPEDIPGAQARYVSRGYCATMGIPVLRGREFNQHDTEESEPVVMIDQELAARFWAGEDPVGTQVAWDSPNPALAVPRRVVGVIGNVKHFTLREATLATIYFPLSQVPPSQTSFVSGNLSIAVRTESEPRAFSTLLRKELLAVDPEVPATPARRMTELRSASLAGTRLVLICVGAFAAAALLLAVGGIYSVIEYTVSQRTREFGIRMAMGARPQDLQWLVLREGMRLAGLGAAAGLLLTLGAAQAIRGLLFGWRAADGLTLLAMTALMAGVALAACSLPARRASRTDVVRVLQAE